LAYYASILTQKLRSQMLMITVSGEKYVLICSNISNVYPVILVDREDANAVWKYVLEHVKNMV